MEWLYATVSVVIISILGLVPIVSMPKLQKSRYQNDLLQFLIGLAIGTLTADALLHLLPISNETCHNSSNNQTLHYSTNSHNISDNNHKHDEHDASHLHSHGNGLWLGFMALFGIIGFLFLERFMLLISDIFQHRGHSVAETKPETEPVSASVQLADPCLHDQNNHHQHDHQNHHQHQHYHLTNKTKSFMFMIVTGDGLHNFFDGIAIGVSYNHSIAIGLSTSIAILCHELPHEIGDFAVLIKSGMTIKRAVLFNTLSSLLCLLGATVGVFIGKLEVSWVSALIAGMFLYISLVDMVPQLDCYQSEPASTRAKKMVVQFTGIGMGIGIMSLIAIYETKLTMLIAS